MTVVEMPASKRLNSFLDTAINTGLCPFDATLKKHNIVNTISHMLCKTCATFMKKPRTRVDNASTMGDKLVKNCDFITPGCKE